MSPNEYQATVVARASKANHELRVRLLNVLPDLEQSLQEYHDLSVKLDGIKKYIFYGKVLKEVELPKIQTDVQNIDLLHALLGSITESAELIEHLDDVDKSGCHKEIGDIQWYVALAASSIGSNLESVMIDNDKKLEARYGKAFDASKAVNHDGK